MIPQALILLIFTTASLAYPHKRDLQSSPSTNTTVCDPSSQCLSGVNQLQAGVHLTPPSSNTTFLLLPGIYTPTALLNLTSLASLVSLSRSTIAPLPGFTTTGTLGSSSAFAVQVQADSFIGFDSPLFAIGSTSFPLTTPSNTSTSSLSLSSTTNSTSIQSILLPSSLPIRLTLSTGQSLFASIPDLTFLSSSTTSSSSSSSSIKVLKTESTSCTSPCSTGGICTLAGTCSCASGFTGQTCNVCLPGFYGPSCAKCPAGCKICDDGIAGTGNCLDGRTVNSTTLASACNCSNGICLSTSTSTSTSTSGTCACNAGWTTAANGTQCAACSAGYYLTSTGDCLACDPTCASCSSPSGVCLTCQTGLSPSSSSPNTCLTSTTALSNGTFTTCPSRTFFSSSTSSCTSCNPVCETCYGSSTNECLSCRIPNVLLEGKCVAVDTKTGVCDGSSVITLSGGKPGWVWDSGKGVCDALPAKCTAGGIDSFTLSSTRSQLKCSACLSGTYLYQGNCVETCPSGTTVGTDGVSCVSCTGSCSTCSLSTSYCLSCTDSTKPTLNGTCLTTTTCPSGYFLPPSTPNSSVIVSPTSTSSSSTCTPCHPDCGTCSGSSTTCTSCSSTRPVFNSQLSTCSPSCPPGDYYDTTSSTCTACSSGCSTCFGSTSSQCLSCPTGLKFSGGKCVVVDCEVVDGLGVCLRDLVVATPTGAAGSGGKGKVLPWWIFLVVGLIVLSLLILGVWCWRRRERKRRAAQTSRFASHLHQKEVDIKLRALPPHIAYPAVPVAPRAPSPHRASFELVEEEIPLTPREGLMPPPRPPRSASRWSVSSYGSKFGGLGQIKMQKTGSSTSTGSGSERGWGDRNPFVKK
ncbi:growth factor receptor domain-containing protein [Meredithblackwellia eburnea MCA 4105]